LKYPHPLRKGTLIRRYKRFLADVLWDEGGEETVHCANPGSMKGCAVPGWKILASVSPNPDRKLKHTLESVHNGACWIGVNPVLANAVAEEGLRAGAVPELAGYPMIEREVRFGEGTRFDFRLTRGEEHCFVEVKSVTLVGEDGFSAFPDAPTSRGVKHLRELLRAKSDGHRAALLFVVQRSDGLTGFRAASEIDPAYSEALSSAHASGLEIYAHWADVRPEGVTLTSKRVPIRL
jgi:sugar fermentation stimulation protein A